MRDDTNPVYHVNPAAGDPAAGDPAAGDPAAGDPALKIVNAVLK